MSLQDLRIEKVYRNLSSDVVNDFYLPVLKESVIYKRAVGFFNSSALYEIATGLQSLVANNGKIQLIVSPKLEDEDVEAIIKGYKSREEVIENALMREFKEPITTFQQKKLNLLANLIADEKLDIKVAFKQDVNSIGIFHEKIGIMHDIYGNTVAFGGSMNETYSGLLQNYESIDVFCSWLPEDAERVGFKEKDFDDLWNNAHTAMEVVEFPKIAIEKLNKYKQEDTNEILSNYNLSIINDTREDITPKKKSEVFFRLPTKTQGFKGLYDYQNEAIDEWMNNDSRGIYNMATGTGKTITALGSLDALSRKLKDNLVVIILCPQTHLIEQWVEDIEWFGVEPLICYSSYDWKNRLKDDVRCLNLGIKKNLCIITTNVSFTSKDMQSQIEKLKCDICLVVDEAHNFGATRQRQQMKDIYKYRLGLSATLERHHDDEGTDALRAFFGKECINYPLERAIAEGKLCRYFYYPITVTLEEDELEAYNQISEKIADILRKRGKNQELPEAAKILLIKRARIISGARNKIKALYDAMQEHKTENNILVYCGATKVPDDNYIGEFDYNYDDEKSFDGQSKRQIDIVADMLGNKLGMRVRRFTSEEGKKDRQLIKRDFSDQDLQCLVAIKCLDEGLNIPGIKTAFILASSTNPKEYIQRRGRVLRTAEGKDFAYIYDFITLPHDLDSGYVNPRTANYELSLIKKEKTRMEDFARLAENSSVADKIFDKMETLYQLNIIGGYDDEF